MTAIEAAERHYAGKVGNVCSGRPPMLFEDGKSPYRYHTEYQPHEPAGALLPLGNGDRHGWQIAMPGYPKGVLSVCKRCGAVYWVGA